MVEIALLAVIIVLVSLCVYNSRHWHIERLEHNDYIKNIDKEIAAASEASKKKEEADERLRQIMDEIADCDSKKNGQLNEIHKLEVTLIGLENDISKAQLSLSAIQDKTENLENSANKVYKAQLSALNEKYKAEENKLSDYYIQLQSTYQESIDIVKKELSDLKATRDAALEASRKEEIVKANKEFYKLSVDNNEYSDILLLNEIKPRFSNPRVIAKLIWSEYYQKKAKEKFPQILGKSSIGIYKITNTLNDKCYIGKTNNLYKRWCDHAKCGCGIDTPKGNKLYAAMLENGLNNFTFEVLEECEENSLDKKESYFIDLYNSVDYGYNSRTESR